MCLGSRGGGSVCIGRGVVVGGLLCSMMELRRTLMLVAIQMEVVLRRRR